MTKARNNGQFDATASIQAEMPAVLAPPVHTRVHRIEASNVQDDYGIVFTSCLGPPGAVTFCGPHFENGCSTTRARLAGVPGPTPITKDTLGTE